MMGRLRVWSPLSRSILNGIARDIFFSTLAIFTRRSREPDLDAGLDEESLAVVHLRDSSYRTADESVIFESEVLRFMRRIERRR
jgi:hypothetical protein